MTTGSSYAVVLISEQYLSVAIEDFFNEQPNLRPTALAVAIVRDGGVVGFHANGQVSQAHPVMPDVDTRFRIASMTKSFTCAALLQLRDHGLLALDTELSELAPEASAIMGPTSDSAAVTVRHLMTMSSGLASDDPWGDRMLDLSEKAFEELMRAGGFFAFPPGDSFEYSNYGYALLGKVIEAASGQRAQDYITEHVVSPLGLSYTNWSIPQALPAVMGRHRRDGLDVGEPLGDGAFAPMGGLWSTVSDLAKWVNFFCDAYPARDAADSALLSRASRREMQRVHTLWGPKILQSPYGPRLSELGYGMGLVVMKHPDLGPVIHHSGGLPGYGSNMRWVPDLGIGIVALAERTYAPMRLLTNELLELLHRDGLLPSPTRGWPQDHTELTAAAQQLVDWVWDINSSSQPNWAINVDADLPLSVRRIETDDILASVGELVSWTLHPNSRASGKISAHTTSGAVDISFSLSPEVPPRVQSFEVVARDT